MQTSLGLQFGTVGTLIVFWQLMGKPKDGFLCWTALLSVGVAFAGCAGSPSMASPSTAEISAGISNWHEANVEFLLNASKQLSRNVAARPSRYEIDRKGMRVPKQRFFDSYGYVSFGGFNPKPRMVTPVIALKPHGDFGFSASLSDIYLPLARTRIWLDERTNGAQLMHFKTKKDGTLEAVRNSVDEVGPEKLKLDNGTLHLEAVNFAVSKADTMQLARADLVHRFEKLTFSDSSCITCHTDRKLGSLAAVLVYSVKPKALPQ